MVGDNPSFHFWGAKVGLCARAVRWLRLANTRKVCANLAFGVQKKRTIREPSIATAQTAQSKGD